jgi:N-acyl-D-aspartate/D-glutamate deacylase
VREKEAFTLEQGVAALTSRAAQFCGLRDRGTLEVGKAADITIFNPETIAPGKLEILEFPGGGSRLRKGATGIPHVIVNGVPIIENGLLTGDAPGQLIRA